MYRIGIDVGGTFTDLVAVDAAGWVTLAKAPSTPADQSIGVMDGLERLAAALGVERGAMLTQTERIVHGTTVATNALLERKGARVGLLTTEGHRDVLEMREGSRTIATTCASRRPSRWCRGTGASACASACAPTAASRRRSIASP